MNRHSLLDNLQAFDDRRDILVPGDQHQTLRLCVDHFIATANAAIKKHGRFTVALSGGSTPEAIYKALAAKSPAPVDWSKVWLFWSDERSVPPGHHDSNYRMAMEAGMGSLGIPENQIFRMRAEENIVENAEAYEQALRANLTNESFDMVMLGMGNDGHTASLFPHTHGLTTRNRLVIGNWIPQLNTWRMSLTFECINAASTICIYVMGKSKAKTLTHVLSSSPDVENLPSQEVGTSVHKALWIVDADAAEDLLNHMASSEPGD
ncbi:MAG: 6-phosphogluconolactonase [Chlamydiales bacterium]|nr:6-phosphogluconolactonase [Chlamydiales bacterium]